MQHFGIWCPRWRVRRKVSIWALLATKPEPIQKPKAQAREPHSKETTTNNMNECKRPHKIVLETIAKHHHQINNDTYRSCILYLVYICIATVTALHCYLLLLFYYMTMYHRSSIIVSSCIITVVSSFEHASCACKVILLLRLRIRQHNCLQNCRHHF